ncbi:hypothetical protein ScPMuIL_013565 [Solemya velum]
MTRLTRAFVTTHWLREQISKASSHRESHIKILEAAWKPNITNSGYEDVYVKDRIPEALDFDLHRCVSSTPLIPRSIPEIPCFTDYVRQLGIRHDSHVIVYDAVNRWPSVRSWWTFRLLGHDNVSILDGGLNKWKKDGYCTTTKAPELKEGFVPSDWEVYFQEDLIRTMSDVMSNLFTKREQLVDARREEKFTGAEWDEGIAPGHIPGAVNVPYLSLFNEDFTFKSSIELERIFREAGVDLDRPIVSMCRTGVTACGLAVAAHILGVDRVPIYNGSWWEWGQIADKKLQVTGREESSRFA